MMSWRTRSRAASRPLSKYWLTSMVMEKSSGFWVGFAEAARTVSSRSSFSRSAMEMTESKSSRGSKRSAGLETADGSGRVGAVAAVTGRSVTGGVEGVGFGFGGFGFAGFGVAWVFAAVGVLVCGFADFGVDF